MTPEQIQELIDTLLNMGETMATEAFRLALKQTLVVAIMNTVWFIVAIGVAVGLYKTTRYGIAQYKKDKYSMWDLGATIAGIGGIFSVVIATNLIGGAIGRFINPEWYAIELVFDLIK